jgi:hypothetical protein
MAAHNCGITIYASQADPNGANQHTYAGCDNYPSPGNSQFKLIYNVEFIAFNNSSTDGYVVATAPTAFTGYLSANATALSWGVYSGSSGGFQTLTNTGGGTLGAGSGPVTTPSAVAFFDVNGQFHEPTAARLSFAAFHLGLLQSEALALFNAVQLYRQTLGGGYV